MRDYRALLIQKAAMPDVRIIQQDIACSDKWDEAYWIGRFVYEQASGEADKLIMEAYEKAFSLGLNIRVNRDCFLTATQQIARIYFQFRKYDEAINQLMVLDSNMDDLPDWVNLYYASAQIHTENVLYWAEVPGMLFRRIDGINEASPESVKSRRFLFLEFLNRISELASRRDVSEVDKDVILAKAAELGVADSRECINFKVALGITPVLPAVTYEPEQDISPETGSESIAAYEQMVAELNERIDELQAIIDKQAEELKAAEERAAASELNQNTVAVHPVQSDAPVVDNFLHRKQKILIIGGSETKENHLRGKLKSMGFNFSKDQLEFELEYDNVKDYASRIRPWSGKYAGIIVGPCPHKAKDIDGYSSFIEQIKSEEGYPHVEEARDKTGTLKISKASIGDAMMRMAVHLQSIV